MGSGRLLAETAAEFIAGHPRHHNVYNGQVRGGSPGFFQTVLTAGAQDDLMSPPLLQKHLDHTKQIQIVVHNQNPGHIFPPRQSLFLRSRSLHQQEFALTNVAQAVRLPHPSPAACFAALTVTFCGGIPSPQLWLSGVRGSGNCELLPAAARDEGEKGWEPETTWHESGLPEKSQPV